MHGRNADPGVWGTMKSTFKQSGYSDSELFGWGYDSSRSTNEVLARQFSAYVADVLHQTGAAQVDIVAHSQGGLPTRWFLRFGGGTSVVRDWVSLGGPNHGTNLAWACALWDQGCRDMTPGSYVESHLAAGNQTPGPTRYATFASHCDEFILPNSSVPLPGPPIPTQAAWLTTTSSPTRRPHKASWRSCGSEPWPSSLSSAVLTTGCPQNRSGDTGGAAIFRCPSGDQRSLRMWSGMSRWTIHPIEVWSTHYSER
ncbi:esterase/lipase family protein [Streptomyces beijiangensis]|uniref:esterase/lipase family protein n=1 Tax=Streptomyces beijiangensis TaxID=163361 RepID=UPI0036155A96